ncbi:MAG: hypothetical protein O7G85_16275 [Planctomycetota bacterium]|nr:hypothetical protein [Planctomycetota bacterium]
MAKTLFFIHGRNYKPPEAKLRKLWYEATRCGLQRDCPVSKVNAYKNVRKKFVYYGDHSNQYLRDVQKKPAGFNTDDSASRQVTLNLLKQLKSNEFTKRNYNRLPGKSAAGEALADIFGGVAAFFRISDPLVGAVAPDMREYWNHDSKFGSDVRESLSIPLARALHRGDKIMLIAHSLGTMIAYDTLWKLSHYSEYRSIRNKKIDVLLTLGSPLGDETVKRNLKGAKADGERQYPTNIRHWINVAAEDDFIAHDEKVKNDFRNMEKLGLVKSIKDIRMYNLAVRNNKSNPHHGVGYLIHPKVTEIIATWL